MSDSNLLHIYSQLYEHGDAVIVGSRSGLLLLAASLLHAVNHGEGETPEYDTPVFATDGEGYQVRVKMLPEETGIPFHKITVEWAKYPPHYCDRGYDDDKHKGNK